MSWEPVTLWALRCDGETTRGQCAHTYHYLPDDDDGDPVQALTADPAVTTWHRGLDSAGWLAIGDRVLCPAHVAAAAYLCAAEIDGLPFEERKPA